MTITGPQAASESAELLRAQMVATLLERGKVTSRRVRRAFETVPRERFAPEAPPAEAYAVWNVVITKRGADGRATSSVSALGCR